MTTSTAPRTLASDAALAVSKAVGQMQFLDRTYGLGLWPAGTDDLRHDLGVMHAHGNLDSVRLELLAADETVLLEWKVSFRRSAAAAAGPRQIDAGGGVEVPLLDRRLVAGKRLLVQRHGRDDAYRHLLRMNWSTAPVLRKRAGSAFTSDHAARISGGRQQGHVHIGAEARRRLLVTHVTDRGFAFAKDLELNLDGVWLHVRFAPPGFRFRVGAPVTAIVIQAPRGLQGRDIAPAAE